MISETEQSRIKHRVSIVLVVMASPFFILCMVFEDIPCLKISSYSDMFFLANVSKNGLYEIMYKAHSLFNTTITYLIGSTYLIY